MKTRVLFLLGLYLALTITLTGISQNSFAEGSQGDPPINDTISDTTTTSIPSSPDESTGLNYWVLIKTIITIGI